MKPFIDSCSERSTETCCDYVGQREAGTALFHWQLLLTLCKLGSMCELLHNYWLHWLTYITLNYFILHPVA